MPMTIRGDRGRAPQAGRRTARSVRRLPRLAWLCAGLLALTGPESRASVEILPLAEVRAGMTGVGRTVFAGETIEEFGVEIIGVLPQSRPQGSLILFRGEGAQLQRSGIIAGMSGSPVYVDGRLIGAVAFAYPMVKEPIGAITPIEEMLALGRQDDLPADEAAGQEAGPLARPEDGGRRDLSSAAAETDGGPAATDGGGGDRSRFDAAWEGFLSRLAGTEEASSAWSDLTPPAGVGATGGYGLAPLAMPLALSGWAPVAVDGLAGSLVPLGLGTTPSTSALLAPAATSGESADDGPAGPGVLEPGAAVGISLVTGDASMAAIGTVTLVDGERVYALGHPMLNGGPVGLPLWRARILTVMPSVEVSFKMGSVTAPIGGVWQDRRAGVFGRLGPVPEMIPVRVLLRGVSNEPLVYRYGVARDRMMTPFLLPWTVANSWLHTGWNTGEIAARCRVRVDYNGGERVQRDELIHTDAPALGLAGAATLPATLLLVNPFERARLDSISVEIDAERRQPQAWVAALTCDRSRVRAGETFRCLVRVEPWRSRPESLVFEIRARPEWAGKRIRLLAAAANDLLEMDRERVPGRFTPRTLAQLVRLVETLPGGETLMLRVTTRDAGALIDGREVAGLPPSLASAGTGAGARAVIRGVAGSLLEEQSRPTGFVLSGAEWTELEVLP